MPHLSHPDYAAELRQLRLSLELSQRAFGAMLGLATSKIGTSPALSAYESGSRSVPEPVIRLARLLAAQLANERKKPLRLSRNAV